MDEPECPGCRERDRRYAALEARVLDLEARLRDLQDKLTPPTPGAPTPPTPGPAKTPTGETRGDQVAILKGLKEGQQVVTSGQVKLKNGTSIVIDNTIVPANSANPTPQEH